VRLCLPIFIICLAGCSDNRSFEVINDTIPSPLTSGVFDVENGKKLFSSRGDAHCVICHSHDDVEVGFQGNLGPDLTRVQDRLSEGQIRLRIVDYDRVVPGTTMPSYFRIHDFNQVPTDKKGETILTAKEIEDIIAFLTHEDR